MESFSGNYVFAVVCFLRSDWSPEAFGSEVSLYAHTDNLSIFRGESSPRENGLGDSFHIQVVISDYATYIVIKEFNVNSAEYSTYTERFGPIIEETDDFELNLFAAKRFVVSHLQSYFLNSDELDCADDLAFLILRNCSKSDMEDGIWQDTLDGEWIGSYGDGDQLNVHDECFAGGVFVDVITTFDVRGIFSSVSGFKFDSDPDSTHDESTRLVAIGK